MGLQQLNFAGLNKVEVAVMRLREFEPPDGYFLAFSGGKDSVVLHALAVEAEVKFDAHYNVTGIDPPELVRFIREHYPEVFWERPRMSMWKAIEANQGGLPTRRYRFCCEELKEHAGQGRRILTGIRWQESVGRRKRAMDEPCLNKPNTRYLHPIIDWRRDEVWEYIYRRALPYCRLYDEGFKRLGCILCPMGSPANAVRDIDRWPKITEAWHRAAARTWARQTEGMMKFASAEVYWQWWLSRKKMGQVIDCPRFI